MARTNIDWAAIGPGVLEDYLSGESPAGIAEKLGTGRSNVKQYIKRHGLLRSMSEARQLGHARGRVKYNPAAGLAALLEHRFDPRKFPWKGDPTKHPCFIKDRTSLKSKRSQGGSSAWRRAVFERDNYTCQHCMARGGRLSAHHILSFSGYPDLQLDVSNGLTLCVECHKKTDNYAGRAKKQNNALPLKIPAT